MFKGSVGARSSRPSGSRKDAQGPKWVAAFASTSETAASRPTAESDGLTFNEMPRVKSSPGDDTQIVNHRPIGNRPARIVAIVNAPEKTRV